MNDTQPVPPVSAPITQPPVMSTPPASKLPLILGVIVAIVAGVGGYVFYNQKSGPVAPVADAGPSEILIGYNADQSTPGINAFSVSSLQGINLAIEEINAAGGILGKPIRLIVTDDKNNPDLSTENVKKLVFEDKVLALFGPTNPAIATRWLDIVQDNEVISIQHITSGAGLATKYADRPRNYVFQVVGSDQAYSQNEVAWAVKSTKNGKIAIVHASTPFAIDASKILIDTLSRWGKSPVIVVENTENASSTEYVKVLKAVKETGADTLIFHSIATDLVQFLKAAEEINYHPVMLSSPTAYVPELPKGAGALASQIVFPVGTLKDTNERTIALNKKILERHTSTPAFSSVARGYDGMMLLKAAFEKAGTTEKQAVRDALENLDQVQGVIKLYDRPFSKVNHNALTAKDLILVRWVGAGVERVPGAENLEIK